MRSMRHRALAWLWMIATCLPAGPAEAQSEGGLVPGAAAVPGELLRVEAQPVRIAPGGEATLRLVARVQSGWHVNANPPSQDYLIATEARLAPAAGLVLGAVRYPAGRSARSGLPGRGSTD